MKTKQNGVKEKTAKSEKAEKRGVERGGFLCWEERIEKVRDNGFMEGLLKMVEDGEKTEAR